jgi:glutathione synthase/RimK-type ligase-like ATP-grasp enzyme
LNTDLYPAQVQVSTRFSGGRIERTLMDESGTRFDLSEVTALWYRRFQAGASLPEELGDTRDACVNEAKRALYGTIASLGCFELDPLMHVRGADHKELQLKRARAHGLLVPETLITNGPAEARAFYDTVGGKVVTKVQSSFAIYRDNREMVVFTSSVKPDDLDSLSDLRFCPMMFQERLDKALELRATVVGREVFTASIDSQRTAETAVDWRRDGIGLIDDWKPYKLPPEVESGLLALMQDFRLNYGAADFIVTPDRRHVLLEVNAGGEWFWLQRNPGLPIADAIARVLLGEAPRNASEN